DGIRDFHVTGVQTCALPICIMAELKAAGFYLSIDDFGTGYSSMSYLKRFQVDELKIDQSFVRELGHNDTDKGIVTAIIQLAHSLNMQVVAEGVEEAEQLDRKSVV